VFDDPQTTHEWRVTGANNKSGIFQLQLTAQGMATINVIANKLLSTNLTDEAVIKIDNVEPSNDEVPFLRNARRILTMEPRAGSPLAGYPVSLQWIAGNGVVKEDLIFSPVLNKETDVYRWEITGSATKSGTFELKLSGPGFQIPIVLPIHRQIQVKYYLSGQEISGGRIIARGIPHMLTVEVLSGLSSVYVTNDSSEFVYNPPLNRQITLVNGAFNTSVFSDSERNVEDAVRLKFSSKYRAEDSVWFAVGP